MEKIHLNSNGSQWIDESMDSPLTSTSLPLEDIIDSEGTIWMLIVIIFAAIVTIVLLFGIAIFIDCRQQKLKERLVCDHIREVNRVRGKLKLPKFRRKQDDERALPVHVDPTTSPV